MTPYPELPAWVDRTVLDEILNRIPEEGRQALLDFLSEKLKELKPPEAALVIETPSDPELSDLFRRLLHGPYV